MEHSTRATDGAGLAVRVKRPERFQVTWCAAALDELVPKDHRVRAVWAFVERLDLAPLYAKIRAVEGSAGRDAVDPKLLLALWIFATIEGIGSARRLDELTERDIVYKWLCGEVGVNYHLLSDFRTAHGAFLDQLLTDTIAVLLHHELITLETVAQDGMRVRAHAGSSSFRRQKTLLQCRVEAAEQVRLLREERDDDDPRDGNARRQAAKERAVEERLRRIDAALEEHVTLTKQKEAREAGSSEQSRCSTTDPEARTMKMADGGFRPAYNVQFATDGDARMIVAVEVTNNGSDGGQLAPMHEAVRRRYGKTPRNYLVDGGFATIADITAVEQAGSHVAAPMLHAERLRENGGDPHARRARDTDAMFAFRQRMLTDESKAQLRRRPSIAEFPNAVCRNHGLQQFRVRGLAKVRTVALWHAIAFNFQRLLNLDLLHMLAPPSTA